MVGCTRWKKKVTCGGHTKGPLPVVKTTTRKLAIQRVDLFVRENSDCVGWAPTPRVSETSRPQNELGAPKEDTERNKRTGDSWMVKNVTEHRRSKDAA